jgi:transcriptional regulator with XRE-family HTH domain
MARIKSWPEDDRPRNGKSISMYENGITLPSVGTLVKIAKVLKKPAGYFLEN